MQPSHTEPDWSRESIDKNVYDPGKYLLAAIRKYQTACKSSGMMSTMNKKLAVLEHRFWSAVTAADIPINALLEGGLYIPHPTGIVIHHDAKIGPNCLIHQNVTIGMVGKVPGLPIIEGGVDIGAGAKILGPIRIGHHAKIGANAVVTKDVPPNSIAVGVPAKVRENPNIA